MTAAGKIRPMAPDDLQAVAEIWLTANTDAHTFIPAQYWQSNYEPVKSQLAQAEIYLYETAGSIQGFIGLTGCYIAGIFVKKRARSHGIGTALLHHTKTLKPALTLSVYEKNTAAIRFYQQEGFQIQSRDTDPAVNETEFHMTWSRP